MPMESDTINYEYLHCDALLEDCAVERSRGESDKFGLPSDT